MTDIIIAAVLFFLLAAFLNALGVALLCLNWQKPPRKDEPPEEEDPCETCPRWYECNGVDRECPYRSHRRS